MLLLPCFEPCLYSFFACFIFPSVPCPIAVAMVFHVGNNWTHSFLLRKLECFTHVLWRIQVSRWYVLRTTQNGDFVLLPVCVAPCWRSGALSAQWRSVGALAPERVVPSLVSPCAHARFCWMFSLTHATALKPSHSNKSYPLDHLQHFDCQSLSLLTSMIFGGSEGKKLLFSLRRITTQ